ncbi:sugar phosphate isomerase/epimerase [Fulvivirga imtechensis AK7]|uniref:Sugar phosphate isomerase/epimerase n=2 Tax=Fulvivirga TaxID=396811 RepID=L8JXI5_9BACT|nr:sugar phosphate isomerase/epimerase [Fulvivirga imtechensis AK7]
MAASAKMATGIQLYTLRDQMAKDPSNTIEKVASIGYKEVESAGYNGQYYGFSAKEFKKMLNENGLKTPSGHYLTGNHAPDQQGTLINGWEQAVDDAAEVGQEYMVLAYLFDNERETLDDYKTLIALINKSAEACKSRGVQFCYHNHAFEFETIEGAVPYDLLLQETDPDLVKMELDLYWTAKANVDPVELFKESPGRYPLWHVKDMDQAGEFAAVGTGTIDFQRIFDHKEDSGLKHFFVEQDQIKGDAYETISTSYKNVNKLLS